MMDRGVAILPIPGRLKAATGFFEGLVGLGRAPASSMKGLGQIRNLGRTASLQALINFPGVTASLRDQKRNAYVTEVHRTARSFKALPSASTSIATPGQIRPFVS